MYLFLGGSAAGVSLERQWWPCSSASKDGHGYGLPLDNCWHVSDHGVLTYTLVRAHLLPGCRVGHHRKLQPSGLLLAGLDEGKVRQGRERSLGFLGLQLLWDCQGVACITRVSGSLAAPEGVTSHSGLLKV